MAIEVRIPTILRTYTGGEKAVEATGTTLRELIDDLENNPPGINDPLIEAKDGKTDLRRFVNLYVNDEDVRFTGGLGTELSDGDQVVVLPAVAVGSLACPAPRHALRHPPRLGRQHPADRAAEAVPVPGRAPVGQA